MIRSLCLCCCFPFQAVARPDKAEVHMIRRLQAVQKSSAVGRRIVLHNAPAYAYMALRCNGDSTVQTQRLPGMRSFCHVTRFPLLQNCTTICTALASLAVPPCTLKLYASGCTTFRAMQRFPTSMYWACMLLLGLNACLPAATEAVNHSTAVSQTYEGFHLSEALQKANDGEGKLEDLLHWAIGKSCAAFSPCYSCKLHGNDQALFSTLQSTVIPSS